MQDRNAAAFISALAEEFGSRIEAEPGLQPFAAELHSVADRPDRSVAEPVNHSTFRRHLPQVLDTVACGPALMSAVLGLAPRLPWIQIFRGGGLPSDLAEGMFAAQAAGPAGLIHNHGMRTGLFLLAPNIHYPFHAHAADEVYVGLSGRLSLQYGLNGEPFDLAAGGTSITPPDCVHSLTTGDEPVLLAFVWMGAVESPNWWWMKRPDGSWEREKWVRRPDASWMLESSEPVSEAMIAAAS